MKIKGEFPSKLSVHKYLNYLNKLDNNFKSKNFIKKFETSSIYLVNNSFKLKYKSHDRHEWRQYFKKDDTVSNVKITKVFYSYGIPGKIF